MEPKILIGQILAFVAPIITFVSYQVNSKKKLLILQTAATVATCLSYLLLGASSGFALNIVALLRNICFGIQKPGSLVSRITTLVFAVAMCVVGAFAWQGPISLLIIVALAINTVCMSLGNPQLLRKSILLTSSMIFVYNIVVFTVGGMLNELIAIVSSIIGIWRFRKKPSKAKTT